jgi:predicted permease
LTVIGVTPPAFLSLEVGDSLDVTVPMMELNRFWPGPPDWNGAFDSWLEIMGRLKPGVTRQQAQAEFDVIYHQLLTDYAPKARPDQKPYLSQMMRNSRLEVKSGAKGYEWGLRHEFSLPLQILMITVALVLLIACANLASLLLARATARKKDIAIRLDLGISRRRLVRQLLTEIVLLAAIGGILGFLLARWGSQFLLRMVATGESPLSLDLIPDAPVLAFTTGVSLLTAILFGLAPAVRATRVDLTPALKEGRGQSGSQPRKRVFGLDNVLVVAQIAISLTLLIGAGLFVRSLQKLWEINPGYNRRNVLMFSLDPRLARYSGTPRIMELYRQVLAGVESLPGVRSVSLSLVRPVDDEAYLVNGVESIDGRKLPEGHGIHVAVNALAPHYFGTLQTPMLLGREFGPGDSRKSPKVAVISETLARECFRNENPIGRRIADHDDGEVQIIGVVKDSRYGSVRDLPPGVLYLPIFQENLAELPFPATFEVRYSGGLPTLLNSIRHEKRTTNANVPLSRVNTLEVQTRDSFATDRLIATVSTFFGVLAMLLACLGLYGTIAYGVARRTGKIGLRMALGAERSDVLRLVVGQGMRLALLGASTGITGALAITRFLSGLLYGVKPTYAAPFVVASLILNGVALLACYIPARRATKVDPMVALRHE